MQADNQQSLVKTVSILISDIRGFTLISEKYSAINMVDLLNKYFQIMNPIIMKYGGTIDKYMGDSIMAIFDTSEDYTNSILNTLACALEMQIAMEKVNNYAKTINMEDIYMGIGINTGKVVSCTLGSDLYHENTVIGDQVNIASRVEAFSLRGQVLISENTYTPIRKHVSIGNINEVTVKGKRQNIRIFELLAIDSPVKLQLPEREDRSSPRVSVDLPLNYQIILGKEVLPDIHKATILDLSYSGMRIKTDQKIEKFSDIKLSIALSLMGISYSEVYAKVLRLYNMDKECGLGLEFTALDEDAKEAIKSFVDSKI